MRTVPFNIPAHYEVKTAEGAEAYALAHIPGEVVFTEEYKPGAWFVHLPVDLRPGDECPVCQCGTLELNEPDDEILCAGECGGFF
jgi:hypothetical protein